MERRKFLLGVIFLGLLFAGGSVSAQSGVNDTESATVTVTISAKTMIDLVPTDLAWTVDPGAACGRYVSGGACNETLGNFSAVQIENIGSWNITQIWFNNTYPSSSPFGTGSPTAGNAGNYVVLANRSETNFYFVSRVEFNVTNQLVYITDPDGNMPPNVSKFTYGRFHNGSNEYFWFIDKPSTGKCNESTYIRIGNVSHTDSQTGTVNFQSGAYGEFTLTPSTTYATGDINDGPLDGYSVAVSNTTAGCRVWFSHWNKDPPFDSLSEAAYTFSSTSNPLVPGDSFYMRIGVIVPQGLHYGSHSGTLYVVAVGAV
jgi:hypothetical protein